MKKAPRQIALEAKKEIEKAYKGGKLHEWLSGQIGTEAASAFDWGPNPGYHVTITEGCPAIWINTGTQTINGSCGISKDYFRFSLQSDLCESLEKIIREELRIKPITTEAESDIAFIRDERRRNADYDDEQFKAYMHRIVEKDAAFCGGGISKRNQAILKYVDRNYGRRRFTVIQGGKADGAKMCIV